MFALLTGPLNPPRPVYADTVGNPSNNDIFEYGSSITSGWWGGGAFTVSQRFGCTNVSAEPPAPTGWCPPAPSTYTHWHQGVDIGMPSGTAIISQIDGTIVDNETGILGIQTNAGNIIYLLHGNAVKTSGPVNIGDELITADSVIPGGGSCIPAGNCSHLHFEVRASSSDVPYSAGQYDEANPEGWLYRIPAAGGNQLISLGPASYLTEFAVTPGPLTSSLAESDRWPPSSWTNWAYYGTPFANGQPQYLLSIQDPVAVRQSPNEWDVFVVTANGDLGLWYKMPNCSGNWLLFPHIGGVTLSAGLAAVTRTSGYLDAFVLSTAGDMYHAYARRGTSCNYTAGWDPSNPFAGSPPGNFWDVTAASANDNNIYVVAKSGYTVWMTHFDNSVWDRWSPLPALPISDMPVAGISAVAWTQSSTSGVQLQSLYIFVRGVNPTGTNYQLFDGLYQSTGWVGWQTYIEEGSAFSPSHFMIAVSWATFRIDLFVVDTQYGNGGWLWHDAFDPHYYSATNNWSGWGNLGAPSNQMLWAHLGIEAMGYPNIDVVSQATPDRSNFQYWHLSSPPWDALPLGP